MFHVVCFVVTTQDQLREMACFTKEADENPRGAAHCRSAASDGIPPLLLELRRRLRWCKVLGSAAPRDKTKRPAGFTPNDDCFTSLERQSRLKERNERLKREDKARRQANKKSAAAAGTG